MSMIVKSEVFRDGGLIPARFTCKGADISPALSWSGLPGETQSLALIMDDPDAPRGWIHWIAYNIPPDIQGLAENVPKVERIQDGMIQGLNDFRQHGYGGPCPPSGTHRYYFRIFALDTVLPYRKDTTFRTLKDSMQGHILDEGVLMGLFHK